MWVARILAAILVVIWGTVLDSPVLAVESVEKEAVVVAMKRLTQSQYRNSITDIFGRDIEFAGRFAPDYRHDRLLSVGSSVASLSPGDYEQYDLMARHIAGQVLSGGALSRSQGCEAAGESGVSEDCMRNFLAYYGRQLFRRPLQETELRRRLAIVAEVVTLGGDVYQGLELALASFLVSPEFLFRIETAQEDPGHPRRWRLDGYSRAARLSYFLWNTTPDEALLRAAEAGELTTPGGLQAQVVRLLDSPRLDNGIRALFSDMLALDRFDELSKDVSLYPAYTPAVAEALQEQTLLTLTKYLLDGEGDYRDLFVLDWMPMNRTLGVVYAVPVPWSEGWQNYRFEAGAARLGLLGQASLLSLHAHAGSSSPTLRGRFIRETFLCQPIPPPPADVDFTLDEAFAVLPTARERLQRHRKETSCAACHHLMDPVGLTLERFDGIGMFRFRENSAAIDASGELDGVKFAGASGLGQALQSHPRVPGCLVDTVFRYGASGTEIPDSQALQAALERRFAKSGYRLPALLQAIAGNEAFFAVSRASVEDRS